MPLVTESTRLRQVTKDRETTETDYQGREPYSPLLRCTHMTRCKLTPVALWLGG